MASYFGTLKNHNHTSTVGDGGQLTNLSVANGLTVSSGNLAVSAGTMQSSGVATAADPAATTNLSTLATTIVWAAALGG